jgi:hypothetical protein
MNKKIEITFDGDKRIINTYGMDMGKFIREINKLKKALDEGNYNQNSYSMEDSLNENSKA